MPRPESLDLMVMMLRGLLIVSVERERREGATVDEISTTLARGGLPHAEIATLLGTTANAVRVAVQRGRRRVKRSTRSAGREVGRNA